MNVNSNSRRQLHPMYSKLSPVLDVPILHHVPPPVFCWTYVIHLSSLVLFRLGSNTPFRRGLLNWFHELLLRV